ncbi:MULTISPECIES: hypothetical protein [unclassified Actinomyces]|uniref:hypothetical protein n=1 Tax=unclassified Actinomyces TaxID=2609248 RepID=UPI002016EA1B|nr:MULTISPECIES: hypothetical protein [unclassified Actinomyces]MCL3776627.1 hypothetical protein [Actinomyces sp. AC-20-1]MCL3790273.1 hypothetical protein [Actinomyces sp. 187325]MCL3791906.1 hypothetical protein [Actinomyces sp. 186855]MCL3795073.1 hypothetical protein [Actinomyces sp. 217892]
MAVTVQQMLLTAHTARWHCLAAALGLRPPYAPSPQWAELDGDGALAVHHATSEYRSGSVGRHVLVDDLDALASRLREAGFDAVIIDEAYAAPSASPTPTGLTSCRSTASSTTSTGTGECQPSPRPEPSRRGLRGDLRPQRERSDLARAERGVGPLPGPGLG